MGNNFMRECWQVKRSNNRKLFKNPNKSTKYELLMGTYIILNNFPESLSVEFVQERKVTTEVIVKKEKLMLATTILI